MFLESNILIFDSRTHIWWIRVLVPLPADRRLVGVTREHASLGRQLHEHVHHRMADRRHVPSSPDGVLEDDVAREAELAVDDEGEMVLRVARRRERLDPQAADL